VKIALRQHCVWQTSQHRRLNRCRRFAPFGTKRDESQNAVALGITSICKNPRVSPIATARSTPAIGILASRGLRLLRFRSQEPRSVLHPPRSLPPASCTHVFRTVRAIQEPYIRLPPAATMTCPVIQRASSLARNVAASAMSSGLPMRPRGVVFST
jgi:hypothetical protein